jgi:D-aspartate ligase
MVEARVGGPLMTVAGKGFGEKAMPAAVVMNMFYTGLGIARSLGERGIRVIGLSAHRGVYGNFTRFAEVRSCPDSREDPESLLKFLVRLGEEIGGPAVIFPTRDDDVLFLDRFRAELGSHFTPAIPSTPALMTCLDKWETYQLAKKTGVPVPATWKVERPAELLRILDEVEYPCVLKPLSAHYWRKADNWERVGARKAICVSSPEELRQEYERVAAADPRVVVQQVVTGGDDRLVVAACYVDRSSRLVASFTAQKVLQVPEGFGTGCIVQTADRQELVSVAARLLEELRFTGIAEVEFKWDSSSRQYRIIEINPRPWDQHRLGHACGVDLIHIAYCDLAGMAPPAVESRQAECKWVAEDVLFLAMVRSLWKLDGSFKVLRRLARGRKIYAIWSMSDPWPSIAYFPKHCLAVLAAGAFHRLRAAFGRRLPNRPSLKEKTVV